MSIQYNNMRRKISIEKSTYDSLKRGIDYYLNDYFRDQDMATDTYYSIIDDNGNFDNDEVDSFVYGICMDAFQFLDFDKSQTPNLNLDEVYEAIKDAFEPYILDNIENYLEKYDLL